MPVYIVDLACRCPHHNYAALFAALRSANAQPFMEGRWLVDVRDEVGAVTRALLSHCAPGDGLFVTEITSETRWTGTGLGDEAKAWLKSRMVRTPAHSATTQEAVTLN